MSDDNYTLQFAYERLGKAKGLDYYITEVYIGPTRETMEMLNKDYKIKETGLHDFFITKQINKSEIDDPRFKSVIRRGDGITVDSALCTKNLEITFVNGDVVIKTEMCSYKTIVKSRTKEEDELVVFLLKYIQQNVEEMFNKFYETIKEDYSINTREELLRFEIGKKGLKNKQRNIIMD